MIPVLVVTGPIGVGKTATLLEADSLLVAAGSRHATIELEELGLSVLSPRSCCYGAPGSPRRVVDATPALGIGKW